MVFDVISSCLVRYLNFASSNRRTLLTLLTFPVTPDGPTDGHSDVLLVHRLSRQPCFGLSYLSVQIPELDFYFPVNHRFLVISHMTNNKTERGRTCCDAQQMLTPPAWHTTATNSSFLLFSGLCFRCLLVQWSCVSGAQTGSGESLSLSQLSLFGVMPV